MTQNLRVVHVLEGNESDLCVVELQQMVALFDHIYPKLRIDLITMTGIFDPATIEWISIKFKVPTNMMFIKQPSTKTMHSVSICGVRVITG